MLATADATSVAGTNLFPDEADFSARPAWQVIEAARRQQLTGELTLQTTPPTRLYLRDGVVYFAERSSDGTLAIRLLVEGVINREQMQRGTVIVNGVEHVGRMFDADPTIDRASVELCAELFTDDVMVDVANREVDGYAMVLYRRHPSGIDRWYAPSTPSATRPAEPEAVEQTQVPAPAAIARPLPSPVITAAPVPVAEPQNNLDAPPITLAVPVTRPVGLDVPPPPLATQPLPITPLVTSSVPVVRANQTAQLPVIPMSPSTSESDAATIADEVAEAIKRAFSGLGAAE